MKTLLFAGLAGVLTMAPGAAFAASDSASGSVPDSLIANTPIDLTFTSSNALAATSQGANRSTHRMGGHRMGGHKMGGVRKMGRHQMKRKGGGRHMKPRNDRHHNVKNDRHHNVMPKNDRHHNINNDRHHNVMPKNDRHHNINNDRHHNVMPKNDRHHNINNDRHHGGNGKHVGRGRMGYGKDYQRPHRGFQIPRTFIQPSFFIGNFGQFGLSRPSSGYGWSRYYDDAVLTDRRGVVRDTRYNLDWDRYNQGYNDGYNAGQATYDQSVFLNDDRVVASPNGYRGGSTTYQGDWNGAYQQDGSYQGDWQGTYRGSDGRTYEGQYSGTFVGNGNIAPAGTTYSGGAPHWQTPVDNGRYDDRRYNQRDDLAYLERCKKSSGIGGAIVGGAIGALAGNRIAGRGNRLGGSLIGGGLGALAGGAIEQGTDRCRKLLKRYGRDRHVERRTYRPAPQQRYAPRRQHRSYGYPQQTYPSGWQGGYQYPAYYYPQAQPTVTTIVIQSAPVTTTTTTTYIEEEVIYTKAKYTPKKRWKPAPKRKWKPRRKPAPILKGCQQAHC